MDKFAPSAACYILHQCQITDVIAFQAELIFFTVNLLERKSHLLLEHIHELRTAVRTTKQKHSFHIDAWVVLPDHVYCIWTLPIGDDDFSNRWRAIKKAFTKSIPKTEYRSKARRKRDEDYAAHMDYIYYNPVKHGWVKKVKEWPFSTFHHLVKKDIYPIDWAAFINATFDAGERK